MLNFCFLPPKRGVMPQLNLKPAHAAVKNYYAALHQLGQLHIDHEMAVRSAFQYLLSSCGRKLNLTLVPEFRIERTRARSNSIIVDGALLDTFHLAHGYWEAKDEKDDLDREIKSKLEKGYPRDNIIFQAPERAVLYQSGARIADENISQPDILAQIINQFFDYKAPHIEEWEQAVIEFSERIPELAAAVKKIIDEERRRNPAFVRSFEDFYALCRQAINPNLSEDAVERMLIQHLLTERIFERIFDNPDFTRRNVVAAEIEKVIVELTKRAFNRNEFLRPLDRFYKAIEVSAENTTGFSEKQAFLNKVYERFFHGYSPKEADTHGIVYTPQPIVNFMVRSVEEILQKEFGRSLGDKGVHILDPFVGTGNFMVNIMDKIKATDLPYKYGNELHCNEVMLLPYYIASMNIEHAYFERTGEYSAFPGICLVDTFELAEAAQASLGFMNEENAQRVKRQKDSPIFVIIGNPPYNVGQLNEDDNNKNRKYPTIDKRVSSTYVKESRATNKNSLSDPYVKAIRWASDRIGPEGVVAFVTNNSFLKAVAFDGMRRRLARDFSAIIHVDLKGDARTSAERRRQEGGNVFLDAIKVSVGITLLVRKTEKTPYCRISLYQARDYLTSEAKGQLLNDAGSYSDMKFEPVALDDSGDWVFGKSGSGYAKLLPIGGKETSRASTQPTGKREVVFQSSSNGLKSNRDTWAYNFDRASLRANITKTIRFYNDEISRWERSNTRADVDAFVRYDPASISWSRDLKLDLKRGRTAEFSESKIRVALYRPFTRRHLYFDRLINEEVYTLTSTLPNPESEKENRLIVMSDIGFRSPHTALATNLLPDVHLCASDAFQCFPFYTYAEDDTNRRENITDWALEKFRSHYKDPSITKWDIFHYIYAVLHHPEYRERYAANLRRELPRIPLSPVSSVPSVVQDFEVFRQQAKAGERLTEIHVHYEQQPEYQLTKKEKAGEKLNWRVTRMRLSKDKTTLIYNDFLTLSEIPTETYDYRLGNRSALEWVIDQYQVSTDKRSGITNDPNRSDDPQYILRLIGQVITVSLETVKIVRSLPPLGLGD
jgi:predicted helicase